jgi:hypothetical protein
VNPIACLLLGPVAGLAADVSGAFVVGDHSEATLRRVLPAPGVNRTSAVDLQTSPQAGLTLAWPNFDASLGYGVGIAAIDVTNRDRPTDPQAAQIWDDERRPVIFQSGQFSLGWGPEPDWRFTLGVGAGYGRRHYLGLAPNLNFMMAPQPAGTAQPPAPAPMAGVTYVPLTDVILTIGSIRGSLGASHRFDATWSGSASASYEVSGGVDEDSQNYVPRQQGPSFGVSATKALSLSDALSTNVTVSDTRVTTMAFRVAGAGAEYQTLTLTEVWAHKFSEPTSGSVGIGITTQRSRPRYGYTWGTSTLPNASANITHTESLEKDSKLTFTGSTGIGTGYNAVTGQILYAVSAGASAGWTYEHFGATLGLSGGQSLHLRATDPDTSRSLSASLTFTYAPWKLIDFQWGGRVGWQFLANSPYGQPPPQWSLFVGIGLRAPPLLF